MEKVVISVLGRDRPGIVAGVSRVLLEKGCNIEDVTQTTLQTEFAGIFIATVPEGLQPDQLLSALRERLDALGLDVLVKGLEPDSEPLMQGTTEPFVVTTFGPDRMGLVAGITEVMARFGVNITNLRAVFRGREDPFRNVMIYEVDVPKAMDHAGFRKALRARADELGLDLTLQHRHIFETINRI
ncbi:MAG: ACT domain-containing protein [Thermodesulfobacteriota bacterium]